MGRVAQVSAALLERGEELESLSSLMAATRRGTGSVAIVEGPAGIGKSSLLDAFADEAAGGGMTVFRARGDELVMESSFAAIREMLWPLARGSEVTATEGPAALAGPVFAGEPVGTADRDRASSVLHGLYWLLAELGDQRPIALLVDDAQWLDTASARFLIYLARRIDTLPVLLVAAVRTGETAAGKNLMAELHGLAARVLRLHPLSEAASASLIRSVLGPRADEALCRSCHDATAGNPFYLRELARALQTEPGRPTVELARRVRSLGVAAIGSNVLLRLTRLGRDCEQFAQALVVLGPDAAMRHVAALAGLDRERATLAVDALVEADLLTPGPVLSFGHPIVHEAIASQLPPARQAALHGEAARLLAADGAASDRVAAHLLSTEAYGEEWVVDALRRAARGALANGAPEAAVSYLRRALAEPPEHRLRQDVLFELGRAEALLPVAQDFTALREALALADEPRRRAEIAIELALALYGVLRNREASAVVTEVLADPDVPPDMVDELTHAAIFCGMDDLTMAEEANAVAQPQLERARRGEVLDPRTLAALASHLISGGSSAPEAALLARQALADERLLTRWLADGYVTATSTLEAAECLDEARTAAERGLAEARARGSAPMLLQLSLVLSQVAERSGDLYTAEEYAAHALDIARDVGAEDYGSIWMAKIVAERGSVERARAMAESVEIPTGTHNAAIVLAMRGSVRAMAGEIEAGLEDVLAAQRMVAHAGSDLDVDVPCASTAAPILMSMGRAEEAREMAARELERAIAFGAPGRHGRALTLCGSLDPGPQGLAWLREAVSVLERSEARLEHAHALVALGSGLIERGERAAAREPLTCGLDLAYRGGGGAIAERARAQLLTLGLRPRRQALSGPEALTPAERRTARMAAGGLSNRQIAQALFVSPKTVESQLSRAYEKLGIRTRAELAAALGG